MDDEHIRAESLRRASVLLDEALWSLPTNKSDTWYGRVGEVYSLIEQARGTLAQLREDINEERL